MVFDPNKNYVFSLVAFLQDMERELRENDWILKVDGKRIVDIHKGDEQARIEGTKWYVYPEWCKEV